jgi:hypothetical protein
MDHPKRWGNLKPAHLSLAKEFLRSAELLGKVASEHEHPSLNAPHLVLLGHSLELTLKAISLWQGMPEEDVRSDKHNLSGPFNRARGHVKSKRLITAAEETVKGLWKAQLRNDKQLYLTSLHGAFADKMPSNYDIGQGLPKLTDAVDWLDKHHSHDGGTFRYYETRLIRLPVISCFGVSRLVVQQTTQWACDFILLELEKEMRNPN